MFPLSTHSIRCCLRCQINVTVPLQCLVKDSQLITSAYSKVAFPPVATAPNALTSHCAHPDSRHLPPYSAGGPGGLLRPHPGRAQGLLPLSLLSFIAVRLATHPALLSRCNWCSNCACAICFRGAVTRSPLMTAKSSRSRARPTCWHSSALGYCRFVFLLVPPSGFIRSDGPRFFIFFLSNARSVSLQSFSQFCDTLASIKYFR